MANGLMSDLSYVGLVLVIDAVTQERSWAGTAIYVPHRMINGSGATPTAALESLVRTALNENLPLPLASSLPLEPVAGDLLQLVVCRSDSAAQATSSWTSTGRFRRKWLWGLPRTIVVTAAQPDEAVEELLLQAKGHTRR